MYLLVGDKECRRKFKGPSFTFCYDENKYANIVNNTIPFRENPTIKQKRRELFHLLVFLELSGKYKNYSYSLSESPDFALSRMWFGRRTGLEVTEVIGDKASYVYTQKKLDELLSSKMSQSERLRQKSYVGSPEALERIIKNKNTKLKDWKTNAKRKISKDVLLCVTYEPLDNPSCLMRRWHERFLSPSELARLKTEFEEIYFLDYSASGKDGGPVLDSIESAIEASRILHDGVTGDY